MLVGGLEVLGVYVLAPLEESSKYLAQLTHILRVFSQNGMSFS
jgi:hypothetical protein